MDYFALDKNDQLNKEKKTTRDTNEEVCALQNEQIHTRAIYPANAIVFNVQEAKKKKRKKRTKPNKQSKDACRENRNILTSNPK